jgi:hypothetical protein
VQPECDRRFSRCVQLQPYVLSRPPLHTYRNRFVRL